MTNSAKIELKLPKLEFNDNEWPNPEDKLNRQPEIENLSHILLNAQSPMVFGLEAPWGDGKSTFIKLWEQYLSYKDLSYVTLNAWESDFCEDPLLPILSAFDSWVAQQKEYSSGKRAWAKAKKMAPGVLKSMAVSGVKAGTLGVLDLDRAIEGALSEAAGNIAGGVVEAFGQKLSALQKFKALLKESLSMLPENQENLIIFIDELDRCRPSYAIELLERAKHLFDVEGVVFVLSMNREQLGKSLGGIYGNNFDGETYLRRFIDVDYRLKSPDIESYVNARLYQPEVKERALSNKDLADQIDFLKISLSWLSEKFKYSLRDINQLIIRLRLVFRSIPKSHSINPHLLVLLLFLREKNFHLYESLVRSPSTINNALMFFVEDDIAAGVIPKAFPVFAGWSIGQLIDIDDRENVLDHWSNLRDRFDLMSDPHRKFSHLIEIARSKNGWDGVSLLNLAHQRLELAVSMNI